ncbi:MAG: ribosome-binding factor A [Candidatus Andersenbacteria bacterium]
MSRRLQKVNKHLQRTFGEILQREAELPPNVLVTIARVDTSYNLKSATVWLYVYPLEQAEATLAQLTHQLYELQGILNRTLDFRPLPRLLLRIDYGAQHAENIECKLAEIKKADHEPPGTPPANR